MYFVCFYHGLCLKGKPWSSGYPVSNVISNGPMRSLEKQQEQTCLQWSSTVSSHLPVTLVDLPCTMVYLPYTMVDLPNTMVDLPTTMTVLTNLLLFLTVSRMFLTCFWPVFCPVLTIFDCIDHLTFLYLFWTVFDPIYTDLWYLHHSLYLLRLMV